ncbi:hypothetical protein HMPREF1978_01429 [Actinomyces graevenitzii F0530]|uniref:Uncharacterized protein n=1 Tax=Actinomyces graevenitzii F0530 TaxID=1321817 RepID=U1PWQ0_9ACTO|nr:hypothetical protein HMPREF1978_01429 [Actinomyces graevenitzii F0530]
MSAGLGATPQGALGGAAWLLRATVWLALGAPSWCWISGGQPSG